MITKKDIETMQDAIREEGMRKDIGVLIDSSGAGGFKVSAGNGMVKNLLLILGLSSLITIFVYQILKDTKPQTNQIVKDQKYAESEQKIVSQFTQAREIYKLKTDKRLTETVKNEIIEVDMYDDSKTVKDQLASEANLATTENALEQNAPYTVDKYNDKADKPIVEIEINNSNTKKKATTKGMSFAGTNISVIAVPLNNKKSVILKEENNIVPAYSQAMDDSHSKKMNWFSPLDTADSYPAEINSLKTRFPDFISPTANDYLAAFDSSLMRISLVNSDSMPIRVDNEDKRFDATIGFGYGFLSTGDLRTLALNNELNYRLSPNFAISFSGGFGQSFFNSNPEPTGASYLKGEFNLYYSPFKNTSLHDFRVGVGPAAYQVSHTYIEGSTIVDGEVTYDFVFEQRKSLGLSFNLEYRYRLNDQVLIGIKGNSQRYFNGDAVTTLLPTIGIRF